MNVEVSMTAGAVPGLGPGTPGLVVLPWLGPGVGMRVVGLDTLLKSGGGRLAEDFAGGGLGQVPLGRASAGGSRSVVRRGDGRVRGMVVVCVWVRRRGRGRPARG